MLHLRLQIGSRFIAPILVSGFCMCTVFNASGNSLLTKEEAVGIANRAVVELGDNYTDLSRLDVAIDEDMKQWTTYRHRIEHSESPSEQAKRLFAELDARLEGKTVWLVKYKRKPKPGYVTFGGGANVWVDTMTGEVLAIIYGEGRLR